METVEVVIRIPKNEYDRIQTSEDIIYDDWIVDVARAIANGTVLPKGHDKLISVNTVKDIINRGISVDTDEDREYVCELIDNAETIIEADKEVDQ